MLGGGKMNKSLSLFGRSASYKPLSTSFQFIATPMCTASITASVANTTLNFNAQLNDYINACNLNQELLLQRTNQYIDRVYATAQNPTATMLRDKNTWPLVKKLVVREELMKAQITGKIDIPVPGFDKQDILSFINGKDLANENDSAINSLIEKISKADDRIYLDALIQYKNTGQANDLLQQSKLQELSKELQNIDMSKITREQYKHLLENYCERVEFHHRESISSNPSNQSMADNIDALYTSDHDAKHIDQETGKIDYRKPVYEEKLNRIGQMEDGNKRRVLANELRGLGLAVAIGFGASFTMSFISEIAQCGINNKQMSDVVFNSIAVGTESGIVAGATYIAGRTVMQAMVDIGLDLQSNFGSVLNSFAVGALSTAVVCTYQYVKLRVSGYSSSDALGAVRRTAISSLSSLTISIIAQVLTNSNYVGIIVSTAVGIMYFSFSLYKTVHAQKLENRLREYSIEEYGLLLNNRKLICAE